MKKDCAILIPSCDAYNDVWPAFFHFFFKFWPDCPFPVYLITEKIIYPDERVKTIALGKDFGWANNVTQALKQINTPYFVYFLEDVFLLKPVETERILKLLEIAKRDSISCLRLYPSPGPDAPYEKEKELGVIAQNAPYRVSTMTAIWNTAAFLRVLRPNENAWQMELDGTKRAAHMNELYVSVYRNSPAIDYYATAIKRGRWFYDAVKMCEREGIMIDKNKRRVETYSRYLGRKFGSLPGMNIFYRAYYKIKKKYIRPRKNVLS